MPHRRAFAGSPDATEYASALPEVIVPINSHRDWRGADDQAERAAFIVEIMGMSRDRFTRIRDMARAV
jgi:hypothetical protein